MFCITAYTAMSGYLITCCQIPYRQQDISWQTSKKIKGLSKSGQNAGAFGRM